MALGALGGGALGHKDIFGVSAATRADQGELQFNQHPIPSLAGLMEGE